MVEQAQGLEIELKLQVSPEDLDRVAVSLKAYGITLSRKAMRARYFDTPDSALCGAGLSLRIRESGRSRVQTMKAEGAALGALMARPEWERKAAGNSPDLHDMPDAMRALLPTEPLDALAAVFTVEVTRRTGTVTHDGSRIEVAIDGGSVIAGGRTSTVAEIELELKEGSPAALFSFARTIASEAPVKLGMLTKSERGYGLLDGSADKPFKGSPAVIRPGSTVAEAFQGIAAACLRQFRLNEDLLLTTESPDALHQARVAIRRLRSALSIFRRVVADERYEHLRRELRWLAALLGEARDIDVLIARTGRRDLLSAAGTDAYARVFDGLASDRARTLGVDLAEWLAVGAWLAAPIDPARKSQPADAFASAMLDRLRRRLKRGGRGLRRQDDDARHEVRIEAKKLRYAAEFFAGLYAKGKSRRRSRRFIAAMQALQEHLGDLNDIATAPIVLARLGIDVPPAAEAERRRLIDASAEAFKELMDRKTFW